MTAIEAGSDLATFLAEEAARNAATARRTDTVAVFAGLDSAAWRPARFTLSSDPAQGAGYEVLHLADPGRRELIPATEMADVEACL